MPPLWFMPVLFQMSSCLLRANYFIVHERWKPAWDIDGLWCKESRNFIKISISCLLPMEETLLSRISVAQSSEQWQTRIKQQCPRRMGSPQDPDMKSLIWRPWYEDPVKSLYYWWILPITDVFPVSRWRAGVLSSVCTWAVLLGNSGTVFGGISP